MLVLFLSHLIPALYVSSSVPKSKAGPGAGQSQEQEDDDGNQTADPNILRDRIPSTRCACRVNGNGRLIRQRGSVLRSGLLITGGDGIDGAERRTAVPTEQGRIRIRKTTIWAVHKLLAYSIGC